MPVQKVQAGAEGQEDRISQEGTWVAAPGHSSAKM